MLVFSFIGMKSQEMKIGQATTLNVVLEPENKALEEVVVTGSKTPRCRHSSRPLPTAVHKEPNYEVQRP